MAFDDLEFPVPIPDPAQPDLRRTTFPDVVGGSATYASLSASCFAPARVVAVVGEDFPEATIETLKGREIDTSGIERVPGRTFRWKGRYHPDMVGRDTLDTQLNVFADFRPKLPPSYLDTPMVLLGNIHPALQLEVLEQLQRPELVVADTMNFWIEGERDALAALLRRVDVLVINDEEARLLAGVHNLVVAARRVLEMGPSKLVIKRGEHGSLYFDAEGMFAAPALPLDHVSDPTGAGDAFAGGLVGHLASQARFDHDSMRLAMVHGTAIASYCVEAVGTSGLEKLQPADVARRVEQIVALTRIPNAAAR